jgi:hypothetical protein
VCDLQAHSPEHPKCPTQPPALSLRIDPRPAPSPGPVRTGWLATATKAATPRPNPRHTPDTTKSSPSSLPHRDRSGQHKSPTQAGLCLARPTPTPASFKKESRQRRVTTPASQTPPPVLPGHSLPLLPCPDQPSLLAVTHKLAHKAGRTPWHTNRFSTPHAALFLVGRGHSSRRGDHPRSAARARPGTHTILIDRSGGGRGLHWGLVGIPWNLADGPEDLARPWPRCFAPAKHRDELRCVLPTHYALGLKEQLCVC